VFDVLAYIPKTFNRWKEYTLTLDQSVWKASLMAKKDSVSWMSNVN
jgi:hypothetical protein